MNAELLEQHLTLVIEANKVTNITRITSLDEARILHIEDSLTGVEAVNNAPFGILGDLGSGAGYPGIPLAIETGRETILIESVGKKAQILKDMIAELGLDDHVSVYSGRAEELALESRNTFSVITARAVSKISCLMELASPLLKIGGRLVCYKANPDSEELAHAKALEGKLGMHLVSDEEFVLSDGATKRRLVIYEKIADAKLKLPRKTGFAQRKPL